MKRSVAYQHLVDQVERSRRVVASIPTEGVLGASFRRLQAWQGARLDASYADIAAQDRFASACTFFLGELYGGREVEARDRQLERALPVMRRFLPVALLHAVGEAMRLQAMSLQFDLDLAALLQNEPQLDQPLLAAAYRQHGQWAGRHEQVELILALGEELDRIVHRPGPRRLVRLMRKPAELVGVGLLQNFLERGLDAFAHMGGAEPFLAVIAERERAALNAMQAGEDWPFGKDLKLVVADPA